MRRGDSLRTGTKMNRLSEKNSPSWRHLSFREATRPVDIPRPIQLKPGDDFIVLFDRESLALSNSQEKAPIRRTESAHSRLIELTSGAIS